MNSWIKASSTRKNIICPLNKLVIVMFASSTMESRETTFAIILMLIQPTASYAKTRKV